MNKKSIYTMILAISLSSLHLTANAERTPPKNFSPNSNLDDSLSFQKLLFNDDFNTKNGWANNDLYRLNNGWYEIESSESGYNTSLRDIYSFNIEGDYLIEAKFKKVYGKDNGGYGLVWGGKNDGNFYGFYLSGNGGFNYGKVENNDWVVITQWLNSDFINQFNAENTISIQKKGYSIKFYVNGTLIHEDAAPILKGIKVGFSTSTPKIKIDYLKISEIE